MDRKFLLLFAKRSACFLPLAFFAPAQAQVTINPQALEPAPPASVPAVPKPVPHPPPARQPPHHTAAATPPPHKPPPIVVPPAPPPVAVLQPLVPPPPAHPVVPPEPAPVVADAKGEADPLTGGIRVLFAAGSADLNAAMNLSLRQVARDSPNGIFNVAAFAAGVPDDPSTPRRLSLSRALAARSLLIAEGIPSTHIYVRALGSNYGDGPADRVDVTVTIPPAAAPAITPPLTTAPATASTTVGPAKPTPARTSATRATRPPP